MHNLEMILKKILSENGLYISIAVLGVVGSVVTMFIDTNAVISVKWLLGTICLSLIVILILLRALIAFEEQKGVPLSIRVIKYLPVEEIFLVRVNYDIAINTLMSIYLNVDGYEKLYGVGFIENVQNHDVSSLRVTRRYIDIPNDFDIENNTVVKMTLPMTIFQEA